MVGKLSFKREINTARRYPEIEPPKSGEKAMHRMKDIKKKQKGGGLKIVASSWKMYLLSRFAKF